MPGPALWRSGPAVALRKESVDRNAVVDASVAAVLAVALRKESVDRNLLTAGDVAAPSVALRKESVDRNRGHGIWPR